MDQRKAELALRARNVCYSTCCAPSPTEHKVLARHHPPDFARRFRFNVPQPQRSASLALRLGVTKYISEHVLHEKASVNPLKADTTGSKSFRWRFSHSLK